MNTANTKWRRKGNEVVEAGRNGRRVLTAVRLFPDDYESLELAASAPDLARENERLRAAMVHAMDACETALRQYSNPAATSANVRMAHAALKTALEKK